MFLFDDTFIFALAKKCCKHDSIIFVNMKGPHYNEP